MQEKTRKRKEGFVGITTMSWSNNTHIDIFAYSEVLTVHEHWDKVVVFFEKRNVWVRENNEKAEARYNEHIFQFRPKGARIDDNGTLTLTYYPITINLEQWRKIVG